MKFLAPATKNKSERSALAFVFLHCRTHGHIATCGLLFGTLTLPVPHVSPDALSCLARQDKVYPDLRFPGARG
jgi:hypothetical protein